MRVRLLLFAVLRDFVGASELELKLEEGTTANDVWRDLASKHPRLTGFREPPLAAINEAYAASDAVLSDGDELAFIPPVAGG